MPPVSDDRPDWAALARTGQPIVIYMGLTHMADDSRGTAGRRACPTTHRRRSIENAIDAAGTHGDRTLGTLVEAAAREKVVSPALIVIGGIVSLRAELMGQK